MFVCDICDKISAPGVKPVKIVAATRDTAYHNTYTVEDEWGKKEERKVDSVGWEIANENTVCPPCAKDHYDIDTPRKDSVERLGTHTFREKQADHFTQTLFDCIVHKALDRVEHNTKRARRDCAVVIPGVKAYVDAGGRKL